MEETVIETVEPTMKKTSYQLSIVDYLVRFPIDCPFERKQAAEQSVSNVGHHLVVDCDRRAKPEFTVISFTVLRQVFTDYLRN